MAILKPADATADTDEKKDTDKKDSDDESSDDEKEKKDVCIIAFPMLNSEHCDK